MCDGCGWRDLVAEIGAALAESAFERQRQREWLEQIRLTTDDNHHATDHQKKVVKRILKEVGSERWRRVPKAMDKTKWSEAKKERIRSRRRQAAAYRRYSQF